MGVDEGNLQVIDVEIIVEKLSNSITLRYILTSSDYILEPSPSETRFWGVSVGG